ncbi:MAG: hypothetical protein HWN68_16240 [Desulfobacterales bacterium]|nr:hypothetical protein [Desulfobacterales bacterium]
MEKAVELILWARAFDKKVDAVRAEEERVEKAFRSALREERFDNEVDQAIRRMLVPWYFFGQPAPVIPALDGNMNDEENDDAKPLP